MEYKKYDNTYMVRLDPEDEVAASIAALCEKEDIRLGSVSGLGAVNEATLGIFDTDAQVYRSRDYAGMYEIASLVGNISRMDGKPYLHLHATIANVTTGECHGGHLSRAVISATGEIVVTAVNGEAGRKPGKIGLNFLTF